MAVGTPYFIKGLQKCRITQPVSLVAMGQTANLLFTLGTIEAFEAEAGRIRAEHRIPLVFYAIRLSGSNVGQLKGDVTRAHPIS